MRIVADHIHTIKALAATSANSLNYGTHCGRYENTINLSHTLYSSKNLTDQFTMLVTENNDLMLKRDTAIADHNALTTQFIQLEAQFIQNLTLMTAATNSLPASRKAPTNPKKFTPEDHGKLRFFMALLHLHLIDCPSEFLNEELNL
jgi:hypothetical protein